MTIERIIEHEDDHHVVYRLESNGVIVGRDTVPKRLDDATLRSFALTSAARIATIGRIRAEDLDDDTIAAIAPIFPPWKPGVTVAVGDVLAWDGTLVEVIQAHTEGDTPDEWVQPQGSHDAYQTGDRVTYNGQIWESTVDGNVWQPGVHGWTLV